ncbi:uncharacterized protein CLAFUR5_03655 [Fulvia fulva]|uniref:Uncharacterized protein n=1 Tax=Passalora fulva TaxID=5499 RepID=A0A9Q8P5C1_PASFU|nr:uncharacterized protein CLAFUR5_03655 [Fulvia fulva]KAK4633386.1 hypothetical protein CLAFUR0_03668 [Fulvia fulva]UJO13965.1 hypothetical protein CLAFUR5_03655 [Fulvia fulva]
MMASETQNITMKLQLVLPALFTAIVAAIALPQNSTATDLKNSLFSDIKIKTNNEERFLELLNICGKPREMDIAKNPGICNCWDFGLTSRRAPMLSAIERACAEIKDVPFGVYGYASHEHIFHTDHWGSEYYIRAKVIWAGKALGREEYCDNLSTLGVDNEDPDNSTRGGYWIPEQNCKENFEAIVNQCDGKEDEKRGGYAADKCFIWWLDPNPASGGG